MDFDLNEIISRLKEVVENSHLSYAQIEKKTGIAKSSIQRYVTGQTQKIPIDNISKIANACGVTPEYVLGWVPDDVDENAEEEKMIRSAKVALFGGAGEVTDAMWEEVVNFAKYVEAREAAKRNENK